MEDRYQIIPGHYNEECVWIQSVNKNVICINTNEIPLILSKRYSNMWRPIASYSPSVIEDINFKNSPWYSMPEIHALLALNPNHFKGISNGNSNNT